MTELLRETSLDAEQLEYAEQIGFSADVLLSLINDILDLIRIIPFRLNTENLYDGLTGTLSFSKYPLAEKNASDMEQLMGNLHSAGFITSICQTSNTYFHLMMIRHGSVFQVQDPWPTSWYLPQMYT